MGTIAIPPTQFLPVGFRFQPTEKEVFDHYLMLRNMDQDFRIVQDYSIYVPDIDVTTLEPWELPVEYKDRLSYQQNDNEWWFFSPRTRDQKTRRKTGCGEWSSTCANKKIPNGDNNQIMGTMKTFAFHHAQYSRLNWILHEYHLSNLNEVLRPNDEKCFVLCHLKLNKDDRGKSKSGGEVGHSGLFEFVQQGIRQTNGEVLSRENVLMPSQQQHPLFGLVNQESISQPERQRKRTNESMEAFFGLVNQESISQQERQRKRTDESMEALFGLVNQEIISQQELQRKRTKESMDALFGLVNQESISANLEQQMHRQDRFLSPYQPQIREVSFNGQQLVESFGSDSSTLSRGSSNGSRSSGCVDFNINILGNSLEDQNVVLFNVPQPVDLFGCDSSTLELPWGSSNGSGSSACANFNKNILHNSLEDQNVFLYDDEQLQMAMFLEDAIASEPLGVSPFQPMPHQDGLSGDPSSSAQQHAILLSNQAQSAKSLSGVVPAEEKKISAENRNARPRPSSLVSPHAVRSPVIVTEPNGFKASNSSASAESFIKSEARSVKEQPSASNPHCKKISSVKIEEDENSAEETTGNLRLTSGSIFITQQQNSVCSPPSKYLANIVVSLVVVFLICWHMLHL